MLYAVNETFYSLQGEGCWVGTPSFFIRLSGCNLTCSFCDTNHFKKEWITELDLLRRVLETKARVVIITGGEPLLQDCSDLVDCLKRAGMRCHVETNGTRSTKANWDWIVCSPKSFDLDNTLLATADEIKFLCGPDKWEEYIEVVLSSYKTVGALYLMPVSEPWPKVKPIEENVKKAVKYCLEHPTFNLTIQLHKYIGVR